ncbi:MAG: hypothetical protein K9N55_00100 [Phycisphaerae bacterium]|nr:hypothetical protein [Phycisphaerae bacterium]
MIDYTDTGILLANSDDLSQIIIFVIILAIGLIGNISKAKAQKRSGHTGDNRPDRKPAGQRPHAPSPRSLGPRAGVDVDGKQKAPKYYEPGGFAEVLKDEALERTLSSRSARALKKQDRWLSPEDEPAIQPIESVKVMEDDLESMGQLEAMEDTQDLFYDGTIADLMVSLDTEDDLAKAIVYSEIISRPVGLREF